LLSQRGSEVKHLFEQVRFGDFVDLLKKVEQDSVVLGTDRLWWSVSRMVSYTGRLDPSVTFYQRIQRSWTDRFGGKLSTTYDPVSGETRGNLAKYFFDVVRPVMGDGAPSHQSIRDIVDRQTALEDWRRSFLQTRH
jgi:hypothetical protein